MSYKKRLISVISVSILALSGCDNNADNDNPNDRPNENDECIITGPVCHGNATQVCQNGKLAETPCPADTTCTNGICEPNTPVTCENVTEPTCHGNIRVYCESQTLKYDTCPAGVCENGRCVECKSDYKACLDTNTRKYCLDGVINTETCPDICTDGECTVQNSFCGDGTQDTNENCDDGPLNGTYGKCRTDCKSISRCGDGIVDAPDEACDPNTDSWYRSCNSQCQLISNTFEDYPSPQNVQSYFTKPWPQCSDQDLFLKYLYYRERFIGNAEKSIPGFVSFGLEDGESLPASGRDPLTNCSNYWRYTDCEYEDLPDAQGAYHYGDTSLWLGIMIHWLASEWKVFHELGIDTKETERYIYYALKAFDRLDLNAEKAFGVEPKLDGFFIRDDMHTDYLKKDGKYRFIRTDAPFKGYECASSAHTCDIHKGTDPVQMLNNGTFVSQDQVTGLFEGYGMLIKFLPDDIVVDDINLRDHAMETVHRLITFMSENKWLLGIEVDGKWLQVPKDWGGYVQMFSGFFANAANQLLGDRFGVSDYNDDVSQLAYSSASKILDNLLWDSWEINNNYNRNLLLRLMAYDDMWDAEKFDQKAIMAGRDLYALMRALAHNETVTDEYPLWEMHQILATAPCGGPCSGISCENPVPGWMGESYFITPRERVGALYYDTIDHNGLDYLIAHNLYLLSYLKKYGHSYSQKLPEDLTDVISGTVSKYIHNNVSFTTFDAKAPENAQDLTIQFCSKPLGDWIRDNIEGNVDIYTNKLRWSCKPDMTCSLAEDASPYKNKNALIFGGKQNTTLNVSSNHHHCIVTFNGDDNITVSGGTAVIEAGNGNNKITVTKAKSVIYTGSGNDTIKALGGMQLIVAGDGDDDITTDVYSDLIDAGQGNDTIHAGDGNNSIQLHDGNNTLYLGGDNSFVRTGNGNNRIKAGNGKNMINLGDGNHMIIAGDGDNSINASYPLKGALHLCLGNGKNTVWGGWSNMCRANDAPNTNFQNNTCPGEKLTTEECSQNTFDKWLSRFE